MQNLSIHDRQFHARFFRTSCHYNDPEKAHPVHTLVRTDQLRGRERPRGDSCYLAAPSPQRQRSQEHSAVDAAEPRPLPSRQPLPGQGIQKCRVKEQPRHPGTQRAQDHHLEAGAWRLGGGGKRKRPSEQFIPREGKGRDDAKTERLISENALRRNSAGRVVFQRPCRRGGGGGVV